MNHGMEEAPGELVLEMRRVLPAPPPAVYAAFSDPRELAKWWGPQGFSIPRLDFHPRVGAAYRIEMQPPDGASFHLTGVFRRADPPARLDFTFVWEEPDPDDVETLVSLTFTPVRGSTELAQTQGPFRTEARRALHQGGWTDSLEKLERLLSLPA